MNCLQALNDVVSLLPDEQIFLAGYFNLPELKWHADDTTVPSGAVYAEFDDILTTYGFEQFVQVPTRGENILDLLLCNSEIVHDVAVLPGISDHKIVTASLTFPQRFRAQDNYRKVFMYDKGNFEGIEKGLTESFEDFELFALENSVDATWEFFKNRLLE